MLLRYLYMLLPVCDIYFALARKLATYGCASPNLVRQLEYA